MSRAGFMLRNPTGRNYGKPPRHHPYVATLNGAIIAGQAFATAQEAIAFAKRVAKIERDNRRTQTK